MTTTAARSPAGMRFHARKVARETRAAVPREIPLGARITGTDWLDGGLTGDDAVELAKALKQAGLDFVDISSGNITSESRWPNEPGFQRSGRRARAQGDRHHATPRSVGMIVSAKQAEAIITEGKSDMVALARAFLDDPHWAWHAAQTRSAPTWRGRCNMRARRRLYGLVRRCRG